MHHAPDDENAESIAELAPDLIVIDYMWTTSGNEWTLLNLLTMDPRTQASRLFLHRGHPSRGGDAGPP